MCPTILQGMRHAVSLAASLLALTGAAFAQERATVAAIETRAELEVLALDPENISDRQVKEVLSKAPAPQVMTFKGTLFADMASFGRFLGAMGYPEARIRPYDVTWDGCTCVECAEIVATMVSHYERDGMVAMLVGHSGGGVVVSRLLYGLTVDHAVRNGNADAKDSRLSWLLRRYRATAKGSGFRSRIHQLPDRRRRLHPRHGSLQADRKLSGT
jgi:hypothetical protein